jgi:hypothetical protein
VLQQRWTHPLLQHNPEPQQPLWQTVGVSR